MLHRFATVAPPPIRRRAGLRLWFWMALAGWLVVVTTGLAERRIALAWDAPDDPNVGDYIVKYGVRSGMYSQSLRTRGATTATVKQLADGVTYFFTVTAVNRFGTESDPSEEIVFADPCAGRVFDVAITPIRLGPNLTKLALAGLPNRKYEVEATEDFLGWTRVGGSAITAEAGVIEVLDAQIAAGRRRFYRARVAGPFTERPDALSVIEASPPGVGRTIAFQAQASRAYELQVSTDGRSWSTLASSPLSPAGGPVSVQDNSSANPSRRYRLLAVSDPLAAHGANCNGAASRPPSLSTPAAQQTYRDIPTAPFLVTVLDSDTPVAALQLSATSSNPALVRASDIKFTGRDTIRTIIITPARGQAGRAIIELVVSDGPNAAATAFEIEVLPFTPEQFPITVRTHGSGTIAPNLDGQLLTPGKTYSMTAKPAAGQIFAGWHGSATSTAPKLTFTMQPNFSVEAYFVPNPFPAARGTYHALFAETNGITHERSGSLRITISSRGAYSARILHQGRALAFSGTFDPNLSATNFVLRNGTNELAIGLNLVSADSEQLIGSVSGESWQAVLEGYRATHDRRSPSPFVGAHTLAFPGAEQGETAPQGWSHGTARVDAGGMATFTGTFADGTSATWRTPVSSSGRWPAHALLHSGHGSALGWLTFANASTNRIAGTLRWTKPSTARSALHREGFTNTVSALGSFYLRPDSTALGPFEFSQAAIRFSGGDLAADLAGVLTWSDKGKLTHTGTNALSISFSTSTGRFHGSVAASARERRRSLKGVVLQQHEIAAGFVTGTNRNASVVILAEP